MAQRRNEPPHQEQVERPGRRRHFGHRPDRHQYTAGSACTRPILLVLYVLPVMAVAIGWGTRLAVVTAVLSATAFHYFFVDSHFTLLLDDLSDVVGLLAFLATAVIVGRMSARLQRAALESARLSDEQSALRRVATLVAQSASPSAVFEAVTREVGLLCGADLARMEQL